MASQMYYEEKLNQCIEDVLDFDYLHLTTDDSDGRSFYFALKRLEDYYENLKEVESPVPPKDHIGTCDSFTAGDGNEKNIVSWDK